MMLKRTMGIALALASVYAAIPSAQAARMFCCVDDNGSRYCSDSLPEVCRTRAYSEFNERGVKVRAVEAPLTEAQQSARDAEDKRRAEEEKLNLEQKRRDQALMATYASERDLDIAKSRAVGDLDRSIKLLQDRLDNAQGQKLKLQANIAALKGKPTPPELADQIRRNELEIQSVTREKDSKQKDLERVVTKYETERKRFRELRGGGVSVGSGPQSPAPDVPPPPPAVPAAQAAPAPAVPAASPAAPPPAPAKPN